MLREYRAYDATVYAPNVRRQHSDWFPKLWAVHQVQRSLQTGKFPDDRAGGKSPCITHFTNILFIQ